MTKYTFIYNIQIAAGQQGSGPARSGGWSETWYRDTWQGAVNPTNLKLSQARLACLPANCSLVGIRAVDLDLKRRAFAVRNDIGTGESGSLTDLPQAAVRFSMPRRPGIAVGLQGKPLTVMLVAIPDNWIVAGQFVNAVGLFANARTRIQAYANALVSDNWKMRTLVTPPEVDQRQIITIHPPGLITYSGERRDWSRWVRLVDVQCNCRSVSGIYRVTSFSRAAEPPPPNTVQIRGWCPCETCSQGTMMDVTYGYALLGDNDSSVNIGNLVATTKKVGASFFPYVGRRSKRQRCK